MTPQIAEIERQFQNVLVSISQPISARLQLHAIKEFLETLGDDWSRYQSHVLELCQYVPKLIEVLQHHGCPPEELDALWQKLADIAATLPAVTELDGYQATVGDLRIKAAALYAHVGEIERSCALLSTHATTTPAAWLQQVAHDAPSDPLERLKYLLNEVKTRDPALAEALRGLIRNWSPISMDPAPAVIVPVVERTLASAESLRQLGNLRGISIVLWNQANLARDNIQADVTVNGHNAGEWIETSVAAARHLLDQLAPAISEKYCAGRVIFDRTDAWHEGRSANLAIAAMLFCSLLRHHDHREQFEVAPNVAMTGDLTPTGEVQTVDDATIPLKVEAAWFSWIEYLVVPAAQLERFRAAAEKLAQRYPHRELTVIGITHLHELFHDRRLTIRQRLNRAQYYARKVWQRKLVLGGVATTLLLLAIIARLLYGPIDRNPVNGTFAQGALTLRNNQGLDIGEIPVGTETAKRGTKHELVAYCDVDGDGINEVIWAQASQDSRQRHGIVYCHSVRLDSNLWSFPLHLDLDYLHKPETQEGIITPYQVAARDADGDGAKEVYVVVHHTYFPSALFKLDAATGRQLGCYVHAGHLQQVKFIDLDGDGIEELLLHGISQPYSQAVLVVLDSRAVRGHGPTTGEYVMVGAEPGNERVYVRLPRSIVGEVFRYVSKYNNAISLDRVQYVERRFVVSVAEGTDGRPAHLLYHFNFDLQLEMVAPTDDFRLLSQRLYAEGRLARLPDYEYFEAYKKTIRYWDGRGWREEVVWRH